MTIFVRVNAIIQEIQIFGPVTTFANYVDKDQIILESQENYQKRSFRNRYHLLGPNGIIKLSIPLVKGKNSGTPIKEVMISYDENWVNMHINTIKSCYGSAPYFVYYADQVFEILSSRYTMLYDLCLESLNLALKLLDLKLKVTETNAYNIEIDTGLDWRNSENISHRTYTGPSYNQVFEEKFGFTGGLSILDLLFCLGPESTIWLKNFRKITYD